MMRRRTVILVTGKDPSIAKGGQVSYLRAHARAAQQAGFVPHIFAPASRSDVEETEIGMLHRVRTSLDLPEALRYGTPEFHRSFLPWQAPLMANAICALAAGEREPVLVHGISSWGWVGSLARLRLNRRGIGVRLINSVYTTAFHESQGKLRGLGAAHSRFDHARYHAAHLWIRAVVSRCERAAYRDADTVVLNYDYVRRLVESEFGPHPDIRRLPYTSEMAFSNRRAGAGKDCVPARDRGSQSPVIVCVSRHDPRKGVDLLLRALAALRQRGVTFQAIITSGGPLLAAHRELASRLGLDERVSFPGWVKEPWPYLRDADIFALPSLEEGSGSVSLIEALEAGLAVAVSRLDGLPEDVRHEDNGLLFESGSVQALADALERLVVDTALRKRLSERGRVTFEERFSPEMMSSALGTLYSTQGN